MHPDPRSGCDERSSQCSDELLSVAAVLTRHPMRHAHKVRWQTPVTGAPHLSGRSPCSDPLPLRARRPLIMMMRSRVWDPGLASGGGRLERGPGRDLAVLEVAPQGNSQPSRQCDDAYATHALAATGEAPVEPLAQGAVGLQAQPAPRQLHQQGSRSLVAGLADALLDLAVAAGAWAPVPGS